VTAAQAAKTAAAARAKEIRDLCVMAKLPELADGYIAGGISSDDIRAHLTTITARLDHVEIDASLSPDGSPKPKSSLNPQAIYAARNTPSKE
jgi:hypothetical protein